MAMVWSVPLASYVIWYVRRTERQARRRLQIASDQINSDTRRSTVAHVSRELLANASGAGFGRPSGNGHLKPHTQPTDRVADPRSGS